MTIDKNDDGAWIVECPAIPGCASQGATKDEALANIAEAIKSFAWRYGPKGLPLTLETHEIELAA